MPLPGESHSAVVLLPNTVMVHPVVRWVSRVWWGLQRPFLLRRVRRPVLEQVEGAVLAILPEVLNPVVFRSGEYLARVVGESPLAELPAGAAARVLDMGTGSGIGAIFAARRGFQVVGVDLNPSAVRCARANVALNGLEARIEIRHGDLFEPVAGQRFHLVLFNPPFFRGRPRDDRFDLAWRSVDVLERFAEGLPAALAPGGRALILLSTDGDAPGMLRALEARGLAVDAIARRHFGNEIMTVYCARRPGEVLP